MLGKCASNGPTYPGLYRNGQTTAEEPRLGGGRKGIPVAVLGKHIPHEWKELTQEGVKAWILAKFPKGHWVLRDERVPGADRSACLFQTAIIIK